MSKLIVFLADGFEECEALLVVDILQSGGVQAVMAAINALSAVQKCELSFRDGSKFTWDGYISCSNNDGDVDSVIEMTISVTPTTVPVFTAGE